MKFRGTGKKAEDLRLNMTAMIDIVFQLLVFFILTFKVTAMETDFDISMPLQNSSSSVTDVIPKLIEVTLRANADRDIAAIEVSDGISFQQFNEGEIFRSLTDYVERAISTEGDPSSASETEVEFVIDSKLRYKFSVMAIEAVSGRKLADGSVKTLIEQIKFRNPGGFE
ncbi:MAG: biopolymer transporter ExbD [Pirellulaceae bacterium]